MAVEQLAAVVSQTLDYACYVPVFGLAPDGLPTLFGPVNFRLLSDSDATKFFADRSKEERETVLRNSKLLGNTCAKVAVRARDADAARFLAERECRRVLDVVNFFSDISHNDGWPYLPGEADSVNAEAWIGHSNGFKILASDRRGPLTSFSFKKLHDEKWLKIPLARIRNLYKSQNGLSELILTAFQWAGRATVESKREESFILYTIALETIVLPVHHGELGYRLRTRTARLLSKNKALRPEIQREIGSLYDIRSKIVHAGSYQVTDEDLGRLRVLVKGAIISILLNRAVNKFKTRQDLEDWFEFQAR
jgi:hypothetical protein